MTKIYPLLLFVLFSGTISAQGIVFEYDNAGNRTKRYQNAAPNLSPSILVSPTMLAGPTNISMVVNVYEFNDVPTSGSIQVYILKDPLYVMSFNSTATAVAGETVSNASWTLNNTNPLYYILTTSQVIPASGSLAFGLTGIFNSGATKGQTVVSVFLYPESGGELDDSDNADDETIVYKP
jgi:hypothetical protein